MHIFKLAKDYSILIISLLCIFLVVPLAWYVTNIALANTYSIITVVEDDVIIMPKMGFLPGDAVMFTVSIQDETCSSSVFTNLFVEVYLDGSLQPTTTVTDCSFNVSIPIGISEMRINTVTSSGFSPPIIYRGDIIWSFMPTVSADPILISTPNGLPIEGEVVSIMVEHTDLSCAEFTSTVSAIKVYNGIVWEFLPHTDCTAEYLVPIGMQTLYIESFLDTATFPQYDAQVVGEASFAVQSSVPISTDPIVITQLGTIVEGSVANFSAEQASLTCTEFTDTDVELGYWDGTTFVITYHSDWNFVVDVPYKITTIDVKAVIHGGNFP